MINEQIAKLLEDHRILFNGEPISFDGVVDEHVYLSSKIRTAFLLKDVNGLETVTNIDGTKSIQMMKNDWPDYMDWLKSQATSQTEKLYKTWPNVCLWIEALKNDNYNYTECLNTWGTFDASRLRANLLEISIINLKKTPGGGSSNSDDVLAATIYGKELLKEEITIVDPQLIICGGTFHFAKILFNIDDTQVSLLPSGASYFIIDNRIYLEFVHPMWFNVDQKILFAYAKSVFSDVKKLII